MARGLARRRHEVPKQALRGNTVLPRRRQHDRGLLLEEGRYGGCKRFGKYTPRWTYTRNLLVCSALCGSGNLSMTSRPMSIWTSAIPTAWISLPFVNTRVDSVVSCGILSTMKCFSTLR